MFDINAEKLHTEESKDQIIFTTPDKCAALELSEDLNCRDPFKVLCGNKSWVEKKDDEYAVMIRSGDKWACVIRGFLLGIMYGSEQGEICEIIDGKHVIYQIKNEIKKENN
jgi:hypothetical protein